MFSLSYDFIFLNVFISPSVLKDSFIIKVFMVDNLFVFSFYFSILNISFHSFLVCKVSAEQYTNNLVVGERGMGLLNVMIFLSLLAYKLLSLSLTFDSYCYCVSSQWSLLWIESYWSILSFMYLNAHIFPQIRKVLWQYYLIKTFCFFLSSPSGIHIMQILFHLMDSFKSHRLSSFLFILFFFFYLWIISNDLSLSTLILLLGWVCC